MATCSTSRCWDSAPPVTSDSRPCDTHAYSYRPARCALDPVAQDVGADDGRLHTEWFGATRLLVVAGWSAWAHLYPVRRLHQLCRAGFSVADRIRHRGPFWWVVCSLTSYPCTCTLRECSRVTVRQVQPPLSNPQL